MTGQITKQELDNSLNKVLVKLGEDTGITIEYIQSSRRKCINYH